MCSFQLTRVSFPPKCNLYITFYISFKLNQNSRPDWLGQRYLISCGCHATCFIRSKAISFARNQELALIFCIVFLVYSILQGIWTGIRTMMMTKYVWAFGCVREIRGRLFL